MKPKQNKIKALLRQNGIDGALVFSPENFHYVTGFAGHQHTVSRQPFFTMAVLDAADSVQSSAITMDFELPTFRLKSKDFRVEKYDTWVGVRQWDEIAGGKEAPAQGAMMGALDVLEREVTSMGLAAGRLGLELDFLPVNCFEALQKRFPKAEFVNISDLFVLARSVKTAEEVAMFRSLCAVADRAFTAVSKIARPGTSEHDMVSCFQREVTASGFCLPSSWSMFSTGESASRLTLPGTAVIKEGDVVKFDAGVNAAFDFYTTDTSRSWIIGRADPALLKLKDRLYEAQRKMLEAVKPGLPICELFRTGYEYVREAYPSYRRGHLGHSISLGPATAEAPFINASTDRPLEVGMILAVEVPCYIDGFAGFNIEDMVHVTETGAEVLTPLTPHYL